MLGNDYKPLKIEVRKKCHMSSEGKKHWSNRMRTNIMKSPFVWRSYATSKDYFIKHFPEGRIPVEHLSSEEAIKNFVFDYLIVSDGDILAFRGWQNMKTRTHIGFTKHWCEIRILSVTNRTVEITNTGRLKHYGFWREAQKKEKEKRFEGY